MQPETGKLAEISIDLIERNPDNPRLFFRPEEIDTLMASISRFGIQVPITVYKEGDRYFLIDGERRWRCADKLNLKTIPAIIHSKPSPLNNLLQMFNIHALREQWDYFTIANKLPVVITRFNHERGHEPNEAELSEETGLTRGQIRRCRLLIELPAKYKDILIEELRLPKQKQQVSEDFFIEMERSLKTVQSRVPSVIERPNQVRDALIKKFRKGVIGNITDFRKLSKIATAVEKLGVKQQEAKAAIAQIFDKTNDVSIDAVFSEHFELRYDERKVIQNIESLADYLSSMKTTEDTALGQELRQGLITLKRLIEKVLKN
jgi:ParB family transcriptional regulator, chromosome partitioning protein